MKSNIENLRKLLETPKRIIVLTGAGVSTESGIPDFKTLDENWKEDISREDFLSVSYFRKNPQNFWRLYRKLFDSKDIYEPNSFHKFIKELEEKHSVLVITQNIDGLHNKAGSSNVAEIHGTVENYVCNKRKCHKIYSRNDFIDIELPKCPSCDSIMRPDVVLFGQDIKATWELFQRVENCDLLICAGTSLKVNPANEIPKIAKNSERCKTTVWINSDSAPKKYDFDLEVVGSFKNFAEEWEAK